MANVYLYKNLPVINYDNEPYYSTVSATVSAFNNYLSKTLNNYAHVNFSKKEVRAHMTYNDSLEYNYMIIFQDSRYFFCFIEDIEYISNEIMATIHFDIDVFQTFIHDVSFRRCLVEREHVANDTFGRYQLDEGLPISSDYVISNTVDVNPTWNIGLAVSDTSELERDDGVSGLIPTIIQIGNEQTTQVLTTSSLNQMQGIVDILVKRNKKDSIIGLYMLPSVSSFNLGSGHIQDGQTTHIFKFIKGVNLPNTDSRTISRGSTIDGYTPKNKKCFIYPYTFVNVTNFNGSNKQLKFELSDNKNQISTTAFYPITINSSPFIYANNYLGLTGNLDTGINGVTYPTLPIIIDTYESYLSANRNSINTAQFFQATDLATGIGTMVASGGTLGADKTLNSVKNIVNYQASLKDVESKGNILKSSFNGNSIVLTGEAMFQLQKMTVKAECIEVIDNYFTMFGYKVNEIKVPQFNSRPYWNYVKTVGCNLTGKCSTNILNQISNIFDNGITIWHSIGSMYNYNLDNTPN